MNKMLDACRKSKDFKINRAAMKSDILLNTIECRLSVLL